MKKSFTYLLVFVFMCQAFVFAYKNTNSQESKSNDVKKEISDVDVYKDVLYRLVKQDELLDEALEKSKTAKFQEDYVSYILNISTLIGKSLNEVASLNKAQLAYVRKDSQTEKYTRSIMTYANRIDRKVRAVSISIEKKYPVANYKNSPVSSKYSVKGKKVSQILKQQRKLKAIKKNIAYLRNSSARVKASGKWLYIASK